MFNSGINKDIHYRVILYDDYGEIIEDTTIIGQDNAYNYGEKKLQNQENEKQILL